MNYFKYIYEIINPLVNAEVYPIDAYQETPLPYVIIEITDINPVDGKVNPTKTDEVEFTVVVADVDVDNAQATAKLIRDALDKVCPYPITSCNLISSTFNFETISRAYNVYQTYYARMDLVTGTIRNYNPLHYNPLHYST